MCNGAACALVLKLLGWRCDDVSIGHLYNVQWLLWPLWPLRSVRRGHSHESRLVVALHSSSRSFKFDVFNWFWPRRTTSCLRRATVLLDYTVSHLAHNAAKCMPFTRLWFPRGLSASDTVRRNWKNFLKITPRGSNCSNLLESYWGASNGHLLLNSSCLDFFACVTWWYFSTKARRYLFSVVNWMGNGDWKEALVPSGVSLFGKSPC